MTPAARRAVDLLERVLAAFPSAEHREGQRQMVVHVADAIDTGNPLVIQAGTGTGKTLGYLIPVIAAGGTAIVATYTKALQDQLASVDLPLLTRVVGDDDELAFTWSILKGRNNYVCRQRISEIENGPEELELGEASTQVKRELRRLIDWANTADTGDVADVPFGISDSVWRKVSLGSDECPGAAKCQFGETCFTEVARERATTANIVVVNFSLYGLDLQQDREFLPEHDVVVFDEVHELEDVVSDTASVVLSARGVANASEAARKALNTQKQSNALAKSARDLDEVLLRHAGERFRGALPEDIADILRMVTTQTDGIADRLREQKDESPELLRAKSVIDRLQAEVRAVLESPANMVSFVSESKGVARLTSAPMRVDGVLAPVWEDTVGILTSATIPQGLPHRLGLAVEDDDIVRVPSPFDYAKNSMLYLAADLPEPNDVRRAEAVHQRIAHLIEVSDGSALVLFTSWTALNAAVAELRGSLGAGITLLAQDDMPKKALLDAFRSDERSCLFATRGFFQGVDVPGNALRLVIIDKVPFPALKDPLLDARRELAGTNSFMVIDVPIAAASLAQAGGRLIRTASDHGVVAVLDPRLPTKRYKSRVLEGLSHMPETTSLDDVERFFFKRRR